MSTGDSKLVFSEAILSIAGAMQIQDLGMLMSNYALAVFL